MNLADGKISKRQWFRMSYLECVTISMMMIPYITLSLAGKYHVLALVVGLAFVVLYGALMLYLADFVPCGYINAIRNHMGWTAGILDVLYALRYLLRATLIAVFFSMILQRYLLQSFSVWWIFLPFLGITLYGASKSMEGRARMFEFLFGWMVVPLILIVVFSVSNIDIGAIMQGITSQSEVSGVFKGAYAILLALSPLELQLYSRPCVKEKDRMGGIWLLVWILFTIVFAYLFIVAILGYGWTASDTTASFNVMEAASFPGGAVARLDYPVMAFWIIGVFAVVSGYLHQTRDFLYSLCEVKQKSGRVVTFVVMFAGACLFAYGMQFESAVKYGMRYFLYADLAIGIVFPLIVMWVKTKKRVKWGIGFVCLTVLAAIGSVLIGDEKLGRQFVQNDFTAIEQKKETGLCAGNAGGNCEGRISVYICDCRYRRVRRGKQHQSDALPCAGRESGDGGSAVPERERAAVGFRAYEADRGRYDGAGDTSTFAGAWAPVGNLEINSGHDGNGWREIYFAGND